jgi:hypothetical protein
MAQAAPLWLGITPPALVNRLVAKLATEVVTKGVTVGFVGVRYLFEALAMHGARFYDFNLHSRMPLVRPAPAA